jgi:23S rRNA (uridine2552-2'-O)-methyltransferase
MARSSKQWLRRHVTDPYVKMAQAQGYRSRAAFKLLEIDAKERLLRPGARVVDLGAAPGGWSQVAAQKVGTGGTVVAVDLLEIAPIPGVTVLKGDVRDSDVKTRIAQVLAGERADVVLADLSPNLSGIPTVDQARAAELVRTAIDFCREYLAAEGAFLAKVFHGESFDELRAELFAAFRAVRTLKPSASRGESRETYLLGKGLKAPPPT